MRTLLWLDDYRDPVNKPEWLVFSPISQPFHTVWLKNYNEFTYWITEFGLPDAICFDHDLCQEHMDYYFNNGGRDNPPNPQQVKFKEKTGYDCAKWLINYCIDNNKKLPKFAVQSANPCGRENIKSLLESFKKHQANLH